MACNPSGDGALVRKRERRIAMILLSINDDKLDKLLNSRKSHIGVGINKAFMDIFTSIATAFTFYLIPEGSIPELLRWGLILLSFIYAIYVIISSLKSLVSGYNYKTLEEEIVGLDETKHRHSLVAIKNTFSTHPNKFLVYWDERWKCYLFPNYRTAKENDCAKVSNAVSNALGINGSVKTSKVAERVTTKKSFSHNNQLRTYAHTLYAVDIDPFPEVAKENEFYISGRRYRWMSLRDMEQDINIMEKNKDVVHLVEEYIV